MRKLKRKKSLEKTMNNLGQGETFEVHFSGKIAPGDILSHPQLEIIGKPIRTEEGYKLKVKEKYD